MIHRIRLLRGPAKGVDEKNAAVFVQGSRDPDGHRNTDRDVTQVGDDRGIHFFVINGGPGIFGNQRRKGCADRTTENGP